jgi:heme/copper-type cytochrome/quinol oxidase subunit 3
VNAIPWTYDERPDTRISNVRLGMWLFIASEAMFFGSLFSAYVLLRTGAESWPDPSGILDPQLALLNTALLLASTLLVNTSRAVGSGLSQVTKLSLSAASGLAFLAVTLFEYQGKIDAGLHPSTNLLLACWFTLTAVHALHVAAGVGVNVWLAARQRVIFPAQPAERLRAARLYWLLVDLVWIAILIAFYLT